MSNPAIKNDLASLTWHKDGNGYKTDEFWITVYRHDIALLSLSQLQAKLLEVAEIDVKKRFGEKYKAQIVSRQSDKKSQILHHFRAVPVNS
jgi:hypothetical protein